MSMNRKQRATIAQETLNVLEHGRYTNLQGESVSITTSLTLAKAHTIHYTPDDFDEVFSIRDNHAQTVNRGAVERNEPHVIPRISEVMSHRIENVLSLCVVHEHHVLVFGAWGCGVFQNRPEEIAQLFKYHLLENEIFKHAFKRVVFAVLDNTKVLHIIGAFEDVFSGKGS